MALFSTYALALRAKGKLYLRNKQDDTDILQFQFNPQEVKKVVHPVYAQAYSAGSDYISFSNSRRPSQWVTNPPMHLQFTLLFASEDLWLKKDGTKDIQEYLDKLKRFMQRDNRTFDVPDLVYEYGSEAHIVRIFSYDEVVKSYTKDGKPKLANVNLDLEIQLYGRK